MLSALAVAIWLRENGRNHLGKWVVLRGDDINETICTLVESREDFRLVRDCVRAGDMVIRMPATWNDQPVIIDVPVRRVAGTLQEAVAMMDQRFPMPDPLPEDHPDDPVRTLPDPLPEELPEEPVRTLPDPLPAEQDASNRPSAARTDFEEATRARPDLAVFDDDENGDIDDDPDATDEGDEPVVDGDEPKPEPKKRSSRKKT